MMVMGWREGLVWCCWEGEGEGEGEGEKGEIYVCIVFGDQMAEETGRALSLKTIKTFQISSFFLLGFIKLLQ